MATSNDMLTTQQFAEKASVSSSTVSKWLRSGKLKGVKEGRKWMISADQLSQIGDAGSPTDKAKQPPTASTGSVKSGGKKGYSIKQFSEITYLTPFGVERFLKDGRLSGVRESSGSWIVDAANLEKSDIKRLVR